MLKPPYTGTMPEDAAAPALPESDALAALDLPAAYREGVVRNLELLAEHWRRFRDDPE